MCRFNFIAAAIGFSEHCQSNPMPIIKLKGVILKRLAIPFVIGLVTIPAALSQPSPEYQPGTIMRVVKQSGAAAANLQYEVSIKVSNTLYTVLYTPPPGVNSVEYFQGLQILVMVKDDTLVFNSRVSGTTEVPILGRETLADESDIDFSKAPSQYYSMKLRNLSEKLDLSKEQQTRIQPILEQEAGEMNYVWANPVLSQKGKLEKLRRAVHTSDQKMKPLLSQTQWDKLERMRQEQQQELSERLKQQNVAQQQK